MIVTDRLILHPWNERHRSAFALMHADREVMADLGGPISRADSDAKFDRCREALRDHNTSRWAVETPAGVFLGYAGIMPRLEETHPLGPHHEIGWRFRREAWGKGYASESAGAALSHARQGVVSTEIVSYTGPSNSRSQAVMHRLGLIRDASRDFELPLHNGHQWQALVWFAPAL